MKFFLLFIGAVCLAGRIHAQTGYITDTVSKAVNISKTNLDSMIKRVNGTLATADQTLLSAWTKFGQDMIKLYTSYYNQFKVYTAVDLSPITNAISNINSMMMQKPQLLQDEPAIQQIYSDARISAQSIEYALNAAAVNMTKACASACSNPNVGTCAKKYAGQLSADPITIDRIANCITTEEKRLSSIGTAVATQYASFVPMVKNFLSVVNACDIPSPAVLNNSSMTTSSQCFTNYLQMFSSTPSYFYSADNTRMMQTQLVGFRGRRCAKLVELDIQDRINLVLTKFYNCLSTGV